MALDLDDDIQIMDGKVGIQIVAPGGGGTYSFPDAVKQQLMLKEVEASNGLYLRSDIKFQVQTSENPEGEWPRPAWFVKETVSGRVWTIIEADHATIRTRMRTVCREITLGGTVDDGTLLLCTIAKPQYGKDESGAPVASYPILMMNVEMRIVEVKQELFVRHEKKEVRISHHLYTTNDAALALIDVTTKIVDSNDREYSVVRITGKNKLGMLAVLEAYSTNVPEEEVRWSDRNL